MKDRHDSIGGRLGQARRTIGSSVEDFSKATGIPASTLKKYESGDRVPGGEALQGIVETGINANWLLTGEGEMQRFSQESVGAVDIDVLAEILYQIEELEKREPGNRDPRLKAKFAAGVYEYIMDEDVPEAERSKEIGRVIRLIRKVG